MIRRPPRSTLSLHDALPIWQLSAAFARRNRSAAAAWRRLASRSVSEADRRRDRKSTRLNSSHQIISYAVFCLKKKKKRKTYRKQKIQRQRIINTVDSGNITR